MSTYILYFSGTASTTVTVEADDLDAAIDAAYDKLPGSLCHHCARSYDMGEMEFDKSAYEVDGEFVEAKS